MYMFNNVPRAVNRRVFRGLVFSLGHGSGDESDRKQMIKAIRMLNNKWLYTHMCMYVCMYSRTCTYVLHALHYATGNILIVSHLCSI